MLLVIWAVCVFCVCSWRMVGRRLKVALLLETWFCPLAASPPRPWTTWRLRTRSRAALATSASPCRSKLWAHAQHMRSRVCVCVVIKLKPGRYTMISHAKVSGNTFIFLTAEDPNGCFQTKSNRPRIRFEAQASALEQRHAACRQMFRVGVNVCSDTQQLHHFCLISPLIKEGGVTATASHVDLPLLSNFYYSLLVDSFCILELIYHKQLSLCACFGLVLYPFSCGFELSGSLAALVSMCVFFTLLDSR